MRWFELVRRTARRLVPAAGAAVVLVMLAPLSAPLSAGQADLGTAAPDQRFTVLNPTGQPPPIERKAMAERPASLDGKTVYLVDVTFNGGDLFLKEMQRWMSANLPNVKTEFRIKRGVYAADDPELWREIQAAGGLMIMAIGH
jgi:hypothetical protein